MLPSRRILKSYPPPRRDAVQAMRLGYGLMIRAIGLFVTIGASLWVLALAK